VTRFLTVLFILASGAIAMPAWAQPEPEFPGVPVDSTALRTLEKAEALFESGNYKRSFFIFRHELAPIGDKYSQYMVGFMHLTGKGTTEDRVAAAAWYRLAAERGTKEFVTVRNQMLVSLTPEQMQECDRLFVELRKQYGDLALMTRAVRDDMRILRDRTGSRVGSGTSPVTIIDLSRGGSMNTGDDYYRRVQERLQSRLAYIAHQTRIEIEDLENLDINSIEMKVAERLEIPE
jgi:hypothetical protein